MLRNTVLTLFLRRVFTPAHLAALFGVALLVVGLCACSIPAPANAGQLQVQPKPTASPSTALPLLLRGMQALSHVQSAHVEIYGTGTVQAHGFQFQGGAPNIAFAFHSRNDIAVKSRAEKGSLTFTYSTYTGRYYSVDGKNATRISVEQIVVGRKLYVRQAGVQTWRIFDLAPLLARASKARADLLSSATLLQLAAQHIAITDEGLANVGAMRVHALQIVLDQQSAAALAASLPVQSQLRQVLLGVRFLSPMQIGLYFDDATGLPAQIQVTGLAIQHTSAPKARTATVSFDVTVTLSRYNVPVRIQAPPVKGIK